jgi:hypothetical protein
MKRITHSKIMQRKPYIRSEIHLLAFTDSENVPISISEHSSNFTFDVFFLSALQLHILIVS